MKQKIMISFIFFTIVSGIFHLENVFAEESITKDLYDDDVTVFDFGRDVFEVTIKKGGGRT